MICPKCHGNKGYCPCSRNIKVGDKVEMIIPNPYFGDASNRLVSLINCGKKNCFIVEKIDRNTVTLDGIGMWRENFRRIVE